MGVQSHPHFEQPTYQQNLVSGNPVHHAEQVEHLLLVDVEALLGKVLGVFLLYLGMVQSQIDLFTFHSLVYGLLQDIKEGADELGVGVGGNHDIVNLAGELL